MGLEVPMGFVERLPDAAEIRLAVGGARNGSGLRWPLLVRVITAIVTRAPIAADPRATAMVEPLK